MWVVGLGWLVSSSTVVITVAGVEVSTTHNCSFPRCISIIIKQSNIQQHLLLCKAFS